MCAVLNWPEPCLFSVEMSDGCPTCSFRSARIYSPRSAYVQSTSESMDSVSEHDAEYTSPSTQSTRVSGYQPGDLKLELKPRQAK